jgi:hypothetical protein
MASGLEGHENPMPGFDTGQIRLERLTFPEKRVPKPEPILV